MTVQGDALTEAPLRRGFFLIETLGKCFKSFE